MKPTDIKYYPLPNGDFVVSYYDGVRKNRIAQTFKEEYKATETYNRLRMWKPPREEKRSLQNCNIEEMMGVYLDEVPEATLGKTPQLVRDFLAQFAFYKISEVDEISLRSFYQRQKLEYDYTSYSLATRKYQLQGFFKWLMSRGLLDESPQIKIVMGRSRTFKRKLIWVKPDQSKKLLDGAKARSPGFLYPMLLLVNETAIKTTGLIDLKWSDFDFKKKTVRLHEGVKIQRRDLQVSDELNEAVRKVDQISENVFTNLEGRPLRKEILVRELRVLKKQLGFETDWVFRDLRYSFGVNFLKAGGDIAALKTLMGHHHVRMTEELYGRFKVGNANIFNIELASSEK